MDIYTNSIRDLGPADKLRLVEQIWDDLAVAQAPIPYRIGVSPKPHDAATK